MVVLIRTVEGIGTMEYDEMQNETEGSVASQLSKRSSKEKEKVFVPAFGEKRRVSKGDKPIVGGANSPSKDKKESSGGR